MNQDFEKAVESLKAAVRQMGAGDTLLLHDVVPPDLARWLTRECKKRNVSLSLWGSGFKYARTTEESRRAEREQQLEHSRAMRDYYDFPG